VQSFIKSSNNAGGLFFTAVRVRKAWGPVISPHTKSAKILKPFEELQIICPRSTADVLQAAGYLIFDKKSLFDGRSISRKNLSVNRLFSIR
jgi:hypothetical protein